MIYIYLLLYSTHSYRNLNTCGNLPPKQPLQRQIANKLGVLWPPVRLGLTGADRLCRHRNSCPHGLTQFKSTCQIRPDVAKTNKIVTHARGEVK